ncbi:MAG: hypothetical protein ACHQRM_07180 [Bacteroidia bacterium]
MDKYKMNKNRDKLTDEELKAKMDFDRFIRDYKPEKNYRSWKFYASVALIALFVAGVYFISREEIEKPVNDKPERTSAFIQSPIPGIDIPYSIFEVDASRDTALLCPSGSLIHIPAGAFRDRFGKGIKGKVTVSYREFHDIGDFFVSGIPMNYDSAGNTYSFESAGMFQINAFQNTEPVFVNPDVMIHIDLASDINGNRFNIYYLDTAARKWTYQREDIINPPTLKSAKQTALREQLKAPVKSTSGAPRFDISFDKNEFPELAVYEGVSFQVSEDEQAYDPKLAMKEWDNVKVNRHPDGTHYLITFSNPGETHIFKVIPVFTGADYTRARYLYEKKLKQYEQDLVKSKSVKSKTDSAYTAQYKMTRNANEDARVTMNGKDAAESSEGLVFRQFAINRFGIWNSDCPQSMPKGKVILARFKDGQKQPLGFAHVYLVEKGKRTMFTYYPSAYSKFSYDPSAQNMIWAVTSDSKLAIFDQEAFGKIKNDKDSSLFVMKITEHKIGSVQEVKKLLGI